jgi:hypothetical protein
VSLATSELTSCRRDALCCVCRLNSAVLLVAPRHHRPGRWPWINQQTTGGDLAVSLGMITRSEQARGRYSLVPGLTPERVMYQASTFFTTPLTRKSPLCGSPAQPPPSPSLVRLRYSSAGPGEENRWSPV